MGLVPLQKQGYNDFCKVFVKGDPYDDPYG